MQTVGLRAGPIVHTTGVEGWSFELYTSFAPEPVARRVNLGLGAGGRIASHTRGEYQPTKTSLTFLVNADGALTLWRGQAAETPRLFRVTAGASIGAGEVRCFKAEGATAPECPTTGIVSAATRAGVHLGQIERAGTPRWVGFFAGAGVGVTLLGSVLQTSPYLELLLINRL